MYLTDVVTLPRFCFGRGVYKRFPELCGNLGARFALVGGRTAMEKGLPAHSPRKREPPSSTPSL